MTATTVFFLKWFELYICYRQLNVHTIFVHLHEDKQLGSMGDHHRSPHFRLRFTTHDEGEKRGPCGADRGNFIRWSKIRRCGDHSKRRCA